MTFAPSRVLVAACSSRARRAAAPRTASPRLAQGRRDRPAGKAPTFKMRVKGAGQVWVHVCKSKKKDTDGVICTDESIGRAKKKGGVYQYKPKFYNFPSSG